MQSPGTVLARGEIAGVPLPAMTPRVAGAAAAARGGAGGAPLPTNPSLLGGGGGRGAATPRQRQLFLHNPKLLTARGGMLAKPGELQAELSARGRRSGSEVTPRQQAPDGADGGRSPPKGLQLALPGARRSSPLSPQKGDRGGGGGEGGGGEGGEGGSDDEGAAMRRSGLAAPPPGSQSKRGPPPGIGLQLKVRIRVRARARARTRVRARVSVEP